MGNIKHTDKPFILNPDKAEEFLNQDNKRFHAAMERQEKYKRPPLPKGGGTKTVSGIFEIPKLRQNNSSILPNPSNRSPRRKRREIIGDKYKDYEFKPLEGFRPPLPDRNLIEHIEYRPSKFEQCVLYGSIGMLVATLSIAFVCNIYSCVSVLLSL